DGADGYANAAHRRLIVQRTCDLVDAVNGLFNKAVATEPDEVVPVANLPLDVAHAGGTCTRGRHRLHGVGVVGGVVRDQPPDRAILHLIESFDDHVVVAPAEASD